MSSKNKPPSPEAIAVMRAWPLDGCWITEDELAEDLAAAGVTTGDRPLTSVLGEARRRSWVLRDQKEQPTLYLPTATGADVAAFGADAAASTA